MEAKNKTKKTINIKYVYKSEGNSQNVNSILKNSFENFLKVEFAKKHAEKQAK